MRKDKISCVGSMFIKQMHFVSAGDVMEGHSHTYDHQTLVAYGSVEIEVDGLTTQFKAPQIIYIRAGKDHKLTALEDNTVAYCIHPLKENDGSGDIIDPDSIPAAVEYIPSNYEQLVK